MMSTTANSHINVVVWILAPRHPHGTNGSGPWPAAVTTWYCAWQGSGATDAWAGGPQLKRTHFPVPVFTPGSQKASLARACALDYCTPPADHRRFWNLRFKNLIRTLFYKKFKKYLFKLWHLIV